MAYGNYQSFKRNIAYTTAIEHDPSDINALIGVSTLCIEKGDYEQAIHVSTQLLKRHIRIASVWNHLGYAYFKLGNHQKALKHLTRAIQLDPDYYYAHYILALMFEKIGQPKLALHACKRCLEIKQGYDDAQKLLKRIRDTH